MTRTRRRCPRCHTELDEGPVLYRCSCCQRSVYAADLDFDFDHVPVKGVNAA